MTATHDQRSCASFHRQQRLLRSPFTNPKFTGGSDTSELTVDIQHCSFRGDDGPALLRLTVRTPEGSASIDLPVDVTDDLSRRLRALGTVASDMDGLEGYHASFYKDDITECAGC